MTGEAAGEEAAPTRGDLEVIPGFVPEKGVRAAPSRGDVDVTPGFVPEKAVRAAPTRGDLEVASTWFLPATVPPAGLGAVPPLAFHLGLLLQDDRVFVPSPAARRRLARVVDDRPEA